MRKQSAVVALLVSGCFSDPAYIGEGPATDTGGSGGTSGTGASGTGTGASGTSGTQSGGTASGGSAPGNGTGSSVPVQGGTGGVPGVTGPTLGFESGSCWVEHHQALAPEFDDRERFTWDADERTLTGGVLAFRLDENGLLVEIWNENNWRDSIEYDTMGAVTSFTHWFNGGEDRRESWDQANEYDDFGRLLSSNLVFRAEGRTEQVAYAYASGPPSLIVRQLGAPFGTNSLRYDIEYDQGRPIFFDTTQANGMLSDRRQAWYDDQGRLLREEWDAGQLGVSGIDGEPDFVQQWFYDDAGRIIRFESDFNSGGEFTSTVDGVPEEIWIFEPECANIAVLPYYMYGIPSWLFPYISTGGWRY